MGTATPTSPSADADDCDDTQPSVFPGAEEYCDTLDNDCDDSVDEEAYTGFWYADADGDSYGDPAVTSNECLAPSGYVGNSDDCDDDNASVNPAATEVCEDGIDNDCDGTATGCWGSGTTSLADANAVLNGETTGDWAGFSVGGGGDFDGDGFADVLVGAPVQAGGGSERGAAYVLHGPISSGSLASSFALQVTGETESGYFGGAVATAGDLDGDGLDDIAVGAVVDGDEGSAFVITDAGYGGSVSGLAHVKLTGENAGDFAGWAVSAAGDASGDGFDDLLIGALMEDANGDAAGSAYLVLGPVTGNVALSDAAVVKLEGEAARDFAGCAVAGVGDVDGDGLNDLLVGAEGEDTGADSAGAAYLVLGPVTASGTLALGDLSAAKFTGENNYNDAGAALSAAGDVNADGYQDLLIGSSTQDSAGSSAGAAYLVLGPVTGELSLASANAKLTGEQAFDFAGTSVAGAGDVDADGYDDIIVGALGESTAGSNAGAVYLLQGPLTGTGSLTTAGVKLVGEVAGDSAGTAVAGAGDTDGDGYPELLVGAVAADSSAGSVYLYSYARW